MNLLFYLNILYGRIWLIITTFLVTLTTVSIGSFYIKPTYTASSTIRVATAAGSISSSDYMYADRIMNTYVQIARSGPILNQLQEQLDLTGEPAVTVEIIPTTELIRITAEERNPLLAMNIANTLANILISQSQELYTGSGKSQTEILEEQLLEVQRELQDKRDAYQRLSTQTPPAQDAIDSAGRSIALIESAYSSLLTQYEQMRLREALRANMISLVDPATLPNKPSKPNILLNLFLGGFVGLAGGIGLAFLIESFKNTLYTEKQIEKAINLPPLGNIPSLNLTNGLIDGDDPAVNDSYRTLKAKILSSNHRTSRLQTIMFTSANPGEGKSTIISNLAITMAKDGKNVLVVDADLRKPKIMELFDLENDIGLSSIIDKEATITEAIQRSFVPQLDILTSGPLSPNPMRLLESPELPVLIDELKSRYDYILFDTSALVPVVDPLFLAPRMDAVCFVVRGSFSGQDEVIDAKTRLEQAGAKIIGVIINRERNLARSQYISYL